MPSTNPPPAIQRPATTLLVGIAFGPPVRGLLGANRLLPVTSGRPVVLQAHSEHGLTTALARAGLHPQAADRSEQSKREQKAADVSGIRTVNEIESGDERGHRVPPNV